MSQRLSEYESLCLRENQLLNKARQTETSSYSSSNADETFSSSSSCKTNSIESVSVDDVSLFVHDDGSSHCSSETSHRSQSFSILKLKKGLNNLRLGESPSLTDKDSIFNLPNSLLKPSASFSVSKSNQNLSNNCYANSHGTPHLDHFDDRSHVYKQSFLSKCQANGCKVDSSHVQKIHSIVPHCSTSSLPSTGFLPEEDFVTRL